MDAFRRFYREVWLLDFEFHAPEGARPTPLCFAAHELVSGRNVSSWIDPRTPPPCPFAPGNDRLLIAFYASAELSCFLALAWPFPTRIVDLYAEFKQRTCGLSVPGGSGLLGALAAFGLDGMATAQKDDMRQLAIRGGPYTATEREMLLAYCQDDVAALRKLCLAMLPALDLPRALLRGRYMAAAARMEWAGIPCDIPTLTQLREHWSALRSRLAQAVNRTCGVFVPTGLPSLSPDSSFGAAVLQVAAAHEVDPVALAWTAEYVWRDSLALYKETQTAHTQARALAGVTASQIHQWEAAGHDASTWPGWDDTASEVATMLPELALGLDVPGGLWALVREPPLRLPRRHDARILDRAADLVAAAPDAVWDEPLTFSAERFEAYLIRKDIPWPRLHSGALALDDDTFRDMAKVWPADIAPIRETRYALSQLKLHDLAVGSDGRNRCLLSAFRSRTGRNQPSNSKYLFGPSCWIRSLIQPAPGRAVCYLDWSQQELAIAAALSGDVAMMEGYQSGDFYMDFAKRVGAAPVWATKETHAALREEYKVLSLGVLYGLSAYGIARRLGVPVAQGRLLLRHHKDTFRRFWTWSEYVEIEGMLGGQVHTPFGWTMRVGPDANPRSIRNFPMQTTGADMLRLACCLCTEAGIQVCAPVHDALLIEASTEAIAATAAHAQALMEHASTLVLPGFPLRTEASITSYPHRYSDPRGAQMWDTVQDLLAEVAGSYAAQEDAVPF